MASWFSLLHLTQHKACWFLEVHPNLMPCQIRLKGAHPSPIIPPKGLDDDNCDLEVAGMSSIF